MPELNARSMTSQIKSYMFVTTFNESILLVTNLIGGDISHNI